MAGINEASPDRNKAKEAIIAMLHRFSKVKGQLFLMAMEGSPTPLCAMAEAILMDELATQFVTDHMKSPSVTPSVN
jgi:hypothetical protein